MKPAALILGIVVSLVLLAAAGVLYALAAGSGAQPYRATIELVRRTEQLASDWSVETARVKADPLADFDGLAAFIPRMAGLKARLSDTALRIPEMPDRLASETRAYLSALAAKEERIERFKTGYAVVRNSTRFLPLAASAVSRQAEEAGEASLAGAMAMLVQEVNLYLAAPTDESAERLRGRLAGLREASLSHPPPLANALANLLAHAAVLLERHAPTETLFQEATSNDLGERADALAGNLAFELARRERRASLYERGMLAAFGGLALFWIGLAVQQRARARPSTGSESAEAPPRAAADAAPEPRIALEPPPRLRAFREDPDEFPLGVAGRERAAALPEPMNAETALLHRFRAERVGESLATAAGRLSARIDQLRETHERLRGALHGRDGLLDPHDAGDVDEALEAGRAIAGHAHREANAIADLAARLAGCAGLPNGHAERDMVDVNACIEEVVAATGADAAATVARRLGDLPDIFASRTEIRLLLAQVLENSVGAVEGLDNRRPTIKINTAQRNDEILITVIDNGDGIAPERRAQIFRPFYTSRNGSMGLGLTLAGHLVKKHEGAIKVNSLPGQGTVLQITLPTGVPGP